jgi:hypothetical protein
MLTVIEMLIFFQDFMGNAKSLYPQNHYYPQNYYYPQNHYYPQNLDNYAALKR